MYIRAEQGVEVSTSAIEEVMPGIMGLGKVASLNGLLSVIAMSERANGVDTEYLRKMAARRLHQIHLKQVAEISPHYSSNDVDEFIEEVLGEKNGE